MNSANSAKILALAGSADQLFIETAFLQQDDRRGDPTSDPLRNFAADSHVCNDTPSAEHSNEVPMPKLAHSVLFFALATTAATAQTRPGALQTIAGAQTSPVVMAHHEDADTASPAQMLTSLPSEAWPVTNWYKQDVYDRADNKIGQILDVLVDHGGKNVAIIIGVGGFLGIGEKDVAVPFDAVHFKKKDNRWQAVINTTKETLRDARGYKYDRNAQSWVPENATGTTGGRSQK